MDELSQKWESLSDIQQATITELLAGKHQGNTMSSLMENFDVARNALETSLNSSGSAMQEHAKWSQSLEARLLKLKAAWQSLSQSFLQSDFLKVALDGIIGLVNGLDKLISTFGALPTLLSVFASFKALLVILKTLNATGGISGLKSLKDILGLLQLSFPRTTALIAKFATALRSTFSGGIISGIKSLGKSLLSLVTTHPYITAAVVAVTLLTTAFTHAQKRAERIAKEVEELTSKFEEQHDALKKIKGDYDTSNEESMISRYDKLSKGVDNLGRNVSLTTDEYSEYQSIVNKIVEQFPSLIAGYDSQGNAILDNKTSVEDLTEAYENLIATENRAILTKAGKIEEDFKNNIELAEDFRDNDGLFGTRFFGSYKLNDSAAKSWKYVLNNNDMFSAWHEAATSAGQKTLWKSGIRLMDDDIAVMSNLLEEAGFAKEGSFWNPETNSEHIERALKEDSGAIMRILNEYYSDIEEYAKESKLVAQAALSDAFDISSSEYYGMSDTMKGIATQIVNGFDYEFFKGLTEDGISIETYVNNMLAQLNALNDADVSSIEAAFNLKTQFNGGDIPYGEYVNGLKSAGDLVDGLVKDGALDKEIASQIKLSLGLDEDGFVKQYEVLKNKLANSETFSIMPSEYKTFLDDLSSEELSVAIGVITEFEKTDAKETIDDIKAALQREMAIQGLTFTLNIESETTALEALNTALAESVSATGLTSESISALKSRYAELESQGYDLSSMFEETSTGIHLNRREFNKLEEAYASQKLAKIDGELKEMKDTYDLLGEEIKNCDDDVKKSELYNDRLTLADKISEAATLAAEYKGLTSAYNDWLSAEEAGQERDMYEKVIAGFENVDDEISRGWIDDGAIEFLELLTGRTDLAGKSASQLKEIYDSLDDKIKGTNYSIRDFFTVDEDGNSTNTGVYNFLESVEDVTGKVDVIKRDAETGNIVGFDFNLYGGDKAIADALGVSEELVQIMLRAADDAGFVVNMDGTYRQLADLQNEAKAAADYLKEIGMTDYDFDFNTTSIESINEQLEKAHQILDNEKFWNKDGTFNFNADGATQAMQIVSTLQAKLDNLTSEKYGIGLTVEDEEFEEPLESLQNYGRKIATLNQLKLNPKANAKEIKQVNGELDEIAKYFAELDEDKKIELGFKADDGIDEVKKKIESGEIKIPTVLDIQANMDKNIEKLVGLGMLNSGQYSDEEKEIIKKRYGLEIEIDEVDNAIHTGSSGRPHGESGGSFALSREANIKIIAETTGIEDVDGLSSKLKGLDDKTIQAIVDVLGQVDVDKLKQTMALLEPKKVEAIAEAIGKGDVEGLKSAITKLEPKQVQAIAEALGYDDVNSLISAIDNLDPKVVEAVANAIGITDVDSLKAAINNLNGKEVDAKVNTDGQAGKVSALQSAIDGLTGKTVEVVVNTVKNVIGNGAAAGEKAKENRFGTVNGTANVNGTTGRAFKQGSWGTKNSGTALGGELGAETIVRDGRFFTIGDNGAEFFKYKKGDIIFNHRQTEELFKNGKVTSGGGRGKALASGTAFSSGTGGIGKVVGETIKKAVKNVSKLITKKAPSEDSGGSGSSGDSGGSTGTGGGSEKVDSNNTTGGGGGSSKAKDEFEETIDWIETKIDRIERAIDRLDQKANNVYKSWSSRNKALVEEIGKVEDEIDLQQKAYDRYIKQADSVGLSEDYAAKVRNGTIDIETVKDEELKKKIDEYQTWYDKALDCKDAIEELKETEASLYAQRVENVATQYEGILGVIEHEKNMLDEYIAQSEASAWLVSDKYYKALISNEKNNISELEAQRDAMIAEFNIAMDSGTIEKGSEAW